MHHQLFARLVIGLAQYLSLDGMSELCCSTNRRQFSMP